MFYSTACSSDIGLCSDFEQVYKLMCCTRAGYSNSSFGSPQV